MGRDEHSHIPHVTRWRANSSEKSFNPKEREESVVVSGLGNFISIPFLCSPYMKAPLWKMGQRHKPQSSAKTKIKTESLFSPLLTISYQVEGSLCLVKARLISLGFPLIRSFGI
ncbi:unnamed protein product [Allacma fusca]|uniref:Uncharacterized protein n=1 Tax=Allacma fusca TaxID=39272 RepID=A0A8J2PRW2_9HEXA|nr:unnamed protein product [Allacma fusca]